MMKRILSGTVSFVILLFAICSCSNTEVTQPSNNYTYTVSFVCPEDALVDGKTAEVSWRNFYSFPVPKREHYVFKGWKFGEEIIDSVGTWNFSQNAELTAVWIPKSYPITYQMYPYLGESMQAYSIETESFALIQPTQVSGQMFIGWTGEGIEKPTKYVFIPQGSFGARSYTAHWINVDDIECKLDGFSFEIVEDHAVVTGYFGEPAQELTIPSDYNGYPVTVIGDSAFYGRGIFTGKLNIPTTIQVIEDNAIGGCSGLPINIVDENGQSIDKNAVNQWHEGAIIGLNNGGLTK